MTQRVHRAVLLSTASLVLASCGGGGGGDDSSPGANPPSNPPTPVDMAPNITSVTSNVMSDSDNTYPTGRIVRIEVDESTGEIDDIVSGTIRIMSASQGYDSDEQNLIFGSLFYEWDTAGLTPADDYVVSITLEDAAGQQSTNSDLSIELVASPPTINKLVTLVDMSIPSAGPPVQIERTYLLDSEFDGPIGYGWTHNYRMRIAESQGRFATPNGFVNAANLVQVFNGDGSASIFSPVGDGTFVSPAGDHRALSVLDNGVFQLESKDGIVHYFSGNGKLFRIEDRNGNATTLQYDSQDVLASVSNDSGQSIDFRYDEDGRIASIVDPSDRIVTYSYDAVGDLVSVSDFVGNATTYQYDALHNLTTITNAEGVETFFSVDSDDLLTSVYGAGGGNRVDFSYGSPSANQITITNAHGRQTILSHDNNGFVTEVTDALGRTSSMTYDSEGNLTSLTSPAGGYSVFSYDNSGNLISASDAQGTSTFFSYDADTNQLRGFTDARGNTMLFTYDVAGNPVEITYADGAFETFAYDDMGNVVRTVDRKNQTIEYSYDSNGNLTRKAFPDGTQDTFTYDGLGNLTSASDENGTLRFSYDSLDRLVQVEYPSGHIVSYGYDSSNRRTTLTYPTGASLAYIYDELSRLTEIRQGADAVVNYIYGPSGQVVRRELQNGVASNYGYDDSGQLVSLINFDPAQVAFSSFAYTYDSQGNRLTMSTVDGTTRYVYDAIGQLVSSTFPDNAVINYSFDVAGNRQSTGGSTGVTNYEVDNLNRYTNIDGDTYSYDANGNMTSKTTSEGTTTFRYDYEDNLIEAITPTDTLVYAYDPLGRRTSKSTSAASTRFIHDLDQVIAELDAADTVQATFVYGRGLDEIIAMERNDLLYFYSHDGLGSVSNLTDETGFLVESYSYDPYGVPDIVSGVSNAYLFTGRAYEPELDLYFYRARFYDPAIGRFINEDPLGLMGGTNLYSYAQNNPVSFVDPLGLSAWEIIEEIRKAFDWFRRNNLTESYGEARRRYEATLPQGRRTLAYVLRDNITGEVVIDPAGFLFPRSWWDSFLDCDSPRRRYCQTREEFIGTGPPSIDDGEEGTCSVGGPECTCQESEPAMCFPDPTFVQPVTGMISSLRAGLPRWNSLERQDQIGLVAELETPYADALVRADVPVFGFAFGENFQSYEVQYGEGTDPSEWITLTSSTDQVTHSLTASDLNDALNVSIKGNLATWDTGLTNYVYLPTHPADHPIDLKGTHTVRLVVTGKDGSTVEDRVTVDVGNVVPNAWGGEVSSPDGLVTLSVPEQSIVDTFRVMSIQQIDAQSVELPRGRSLVSAVYSAREPGEPFTKPAELRFVLDSASLDAPGSNRYGIYGYDEPSGNWEYISSSRIPELNAIVADVSRLHDFYAVLESDSEAEGSRIARPVSSTIARWLEAIPTHNDFFAVDNTFESGLDDWSNRDRWAGAEVALDDTVTFDGTNALRITNTNRGGNFAVNAVRQPFDAREHPVVEFDYRVPEDVKVNLLFLVDGRWYEVRFTDDENQLAANRVNIASIGRVEGVVADDQWHTAKFNLYDMLLTKTRNTRVEAVVLADWDVSGYMLLKYGSNPEGATYFVDNFRIGRDPATTARDAVRVLTVDDFNKRKAENAFAERTDVFMSPSHGTIEAQFDAEIVDGRGHALRFAYSVDSPEGFAGYVSRLPDLDLRPYQALTLRVLGDGEDQDARVGLRDIHGAEVKVALSRYAERLIDSEWQTITIPLAAFAGPLDWSHIDQLSLAFEHALHASGSLYIDDLSFADTLQAYVIDSFESDDESNWLNGHHYVYQSGAATISGAWRDVMDNGIYRISYGGNIGAMSAFASEPKSFAGWSTELNGIDCTRCTSLSVKIRGAEGGEDATVYLDDGNFRWGWPLSTFAEISDDWQTLEVPLEEFSLYGVDMTHLDKLELVFEGSKMSGTIYLDDLRLH